MTHDSTQPRGRFDRRRFLAGAAGFAAAGALAACGSDDDSPGGGGNTTANGSGNGNGTGTGAGNSGGGASGSGSGGGGSTVPTFVPFTEVKPDLPAGDHGIPAGFYHYPANPVSFTKGTPGKGGKLTIMSQGSPAKVPEDKNTRWKALNEALGVDLDMQITTSADYRKKFQVTIAGGMKADIALWTMISHTPQVLEQDFTDLTPYLGGDNVKQYPGLASIPTAAWQIPMINGQIWGIPQARPSAGQIANVRGDLLAKIGLKPADLKISNGQDFENLCKEMTSKKDVRYAMGEEPQTWVLNAVLEMMGAPNLWAEENGKFTSVNETDQMKDALAEVKKLWDAGYIHPDAFSSGHLTWLESGTLVIYFQSVAGWPAYAKTHPDWDLQVITAPKWDGGGIADKILGVAGYGAFAAFRKADDARIKELLDIVNYIAAPFGTKEYLLVNYGVEGTDYTLQDGDPVATEEGKSDGVPGLSYVGSQTFASLYVPGQKELVDAEHKYLSTVLPHGVANPAWGLYSQTQVTSGATADQTLYDRKADIIQGRKSIKDWDDLVQAWRKSAGDGMRSDYEKAFAATHS